MQQCSMWIKSLIGVLGFGLFMLGSAGVGQAAEHGRVVKTSGRIRAAHHGARFHHATYRRFVRRHGTHRHLLHEAVWHGNRHRLIHRARYLWCVPYARRISHIHLIGDAFLWWAEAAGRYARGSRPEAGAVLNFRSTHRIPLGHVAVVAKVINNREILVNQANWIPDTVTHDTAVIDVSPNNTWTAVRVSVGHGKFGMVYPTYGFIYDHKPATTIFASGTGANEVAEAPVIPKMRLAAPNRSLR